MSIAILLGGGMIVICMAIQCAVASVFLRSWSQKIMDIRLNE